MKPVPSLLLIAATICSSQESAFGQVTPTPFPTPPSPRPTFPTATVHTSSVPTPITPPAGGNQPTTPLVPTTPAPTLPANDGAPTTAPITVTPAPALTDKWNIRGVNLGGMFILESYVTPSFFWQFEGKPPQETAIDSNSFCRILGGKEANRQLKAHWAKWITEKDIKQIAATGVNAVRLPLPDWSFISYQPFTNGCWDGALDYADKIIGWCKKYNLQVWVDLHTTQGGANGWDHGGIARDIRWTGVGEYEKVANPAWLMEYSEYNSPAVYAVGKGNATDGSWPPPEHYKVGNESEANVQHTLDVLKAMAEKYAKNPAVVGIMDIINEPLWSTPIPLLKKFYRRAEELMQEVAPNWKRTFHDSFQGDINIWGGVDGLPGSSKDVSLDSHLYYGFSNTFNKVEDFFKAICYTGDNLRTLRSTGTRVVVGEWSGATDSCALWVGGWHSVGREADLLECPITNCTGCTPTVPKVTNITGSGGKGVDKDCLCTVSRLLPTSLVQEIYRRQLSAWTNSDGWMFWNFKTETRDPRWDFLNAYRLGYLPKNLSDTASYANACSQPCVGTSEYKCTDILNKLPGYVGLDLDGNPITSLADINKGSRTSDSDGSASSALKLQIEAVTLVLTLLGIISNYLL